MSWVPTVWTVLRAPRTAAFPKEPVVWGRGWDCPDSWRRAFPSDVGQRAESHPNRRQTDSGCESCATLVEWLLLHPEEEHPAQRTCIQAKEKNKGIFCAKRRKLRFKVSKAISQVNDEMWFQSSGSFNFKSVALSTLTAISYPRDMGRGISHQSSDLLRSKLQPEVSYCLHGGLWLF